MSKRIIAVIGATGIQGGSAVKFLLQDGTFAVRGITRDPESPAAKALSAKGAELVKADARNPESLVAAFSGAYGVFAVTNFWERMDGDDERAQGKAMVDAAKQVGVQHFVWSTLDHSKFKAEHWETKADVDDYLKASGVPRTSLYTSFYTENFAKLLPLPKRPDGSYDFSFKADPDVPMAVYCATETGAWALAAFKNPKEWLDKDMRIASEFITVKDMAKAMSEASGKVIHVHDVTIDLTPLHAENRTLEHEMLANYQILLYYCKPPFRDPELAKRLYPGLTPFRTWVKEHIHEIVT